MAHLESLVISPAAMPRAGPGAGSATHGMGVQWEPGFLVWGGERELEKTFKGQHLREWLAERAFHMDSAHPAPHLWVPGSCTRASQVTARLRLQGHREIEFWAAGSCRSHLRSPHPQFMLHVEKV